MSSRLTDLCKNILEFLKDTAQYCDRYIDEHKQIMDEVHNLCSNYCERVWNAV